MIAIDHSVATASRSPTRSALPSKLFETTLAVNKTAHLAKDATGTLFSYGSLEKERLVVRVCFDDQSIPRTGPKIELRDSTLA